jgi:hypothetical protein
MARSAVLVGRTLADESRSALALAFIIGLGVLVGRPGRGGAVTAITGAGRTRHPAEGGTNPAESRGSHPLPLLGLLGLPPR